MYTQPLKAVYTIDKMCATNALSRHKLTCEISTYFKYNSN